MGKAKKFDEGKADLSLVSPILKQGIAKTMGFGAGKYGRYNYLQGGFRVGRIMASLYRHLDAFQSGEDIDPESGEHHLFHAAANIQMLVDNLHQGTIEDNRFMYRKGDNDVPKLGNKKDV